MTNQHAAPASKIPANAIHPGDVIRVRNGRPAMVTIVEIIPGSGVDAQCITRKGRQVRLALGSADRITRLAAGRFTS